MIMKVSRENLPFITVTVFIIPMPMQFAISPPTTQPSPYLVIHVADLDLCAWMFLIMWWLALPAKSSLMLWFIETFFKQYKLWLWPFATNGYTNKCLWLIHLIGRRTELLIVLEVKSLITELVCFLFCGPHISVENLLAIQIEIFQSWPKQWISQLTGQQSYNHTASVAKSASQL